MATCNPVYLLDGIAQLYYVVSHQKVTLHFIILHLLKSGSEAPARLPATLFTLLYFYSTTILCSITSEDNITPYYFTSHEVGIRSSCVATCNPVYLLYLIAQLHYVVSHQKTTLHFIILHRDQELLRGYLQP